MTRRRNSWREEPYWSWAWPYADEQRPQYQHMAHELSVNPAPQGEYHGGLYVPNLASPSGWELHHVYGEPPKPPAPRKLGL